LTADSTGPAADAVASDEAALLEAIRQQPLPQHVAVIMDGNGRWAGLRGLPRVAGHRAYWFGWYGAFRDPQGAEIWLWQRARRRRRRR